MNYFFGNARNERGLCATPDCAQQPIHTCVFKYCEECFDQIMKDLVEGRTPNLAQMKSREGGESAAKESSPR